MHSKKPTENDVNKTVYHTGPTKGPLHSKLECGPMTNVMVALPNTGGALCSMAQSLADAHY